MLPSSLSGEEALMRGVHILDSAMSKMIAEFCEKRKNLKKKIAEMYIKKEKLYEKVLVKVKALFEWLVNIE